MDYKEKLINEIIQSHETTHKLIKELKSRERAEELLRQVKIEREAEELKKEDELLLKLAEENKKPLSPIFEDLTPERFILKQKGRRKKE